MENNKLLTAALAILLFNGCNYKEDNVYPNQVILSISHTPAAISADGVSKALITVQLPDNASDTKRTVILTTTRGLFDIVAKNTITVTASNVHENSSLKVKAYASLISTTDEGVSVINAAVGNFNVSDTIVFERAYPDTIQLQVDKLNYKPDATTEVTMTVQLIRNTGTGTPSTGQTVGLTVVDSLNNPIGQFRNKVAITDNTGKCVNYFSLPYGSTYLGRIIATASVTGGNNKVLTDSETIKIVK